MMGAFGRRLSLLEKKGSGKLENRQLIESLASRLEAVASQLKEVAQQTENIGRKVVIAEEKESLGLRRLEARISESRASSHDIAGAIEDIGRRIEEVEGEGRRQYQQQLKEGREDLQMLTRMAISSEVRLGEVDSELSHMQERVRACEQHALRSTAGRHASPVPVPGLNADVNLRDKLDEFFSGRDARDASRASRGHAFSNYSGGGTQGGQGPGDSNQHIGRGRDWENGILRKVSGLDRDLQCVGDRLSSLGSLLASPGASHTTDPW
ncbi:unnamed protein product [Chrysoparadoxa australica]